MKGSSVNSNGHVKLFIHFLSFTDLNKGILEKKFEIFKFFHSKMDDLLRFKRAQLFFPERPRFETWPVVESPHKFI